MFVNDCITCILGYAHDAELIFNDLAITLFAWTVEYSTKLTLALLSRFYRQQIELSTFRVRGLFTSWAYTSGCI